jgi:hypothetical protein
MWYQSLWLGTVVATARGESAVSTVEAAEELHGGMEVLHGDVEAAAAMAARERRPWRCSCA